MKGVVATRLHGHTLDIDIRNELEQYDWVNARWTHDKLIAASPFRHDKRPSFFVRLESDGVHQQGVWADSGAVDDEWASGNLAKLLSFLRGETYEEAVEYLVTKYGRHTDVFDTDEPLTIRLPKNVRKSRLKPLDEALLDKYKWRHPYLERRGISEAVQRMMEVGYDRKRKAVSIPWRTPNGCLANIKYRSISSKSFWYEKGGWPIKTLVYGMHIVYERKIRKAVLCEAEIDAMTAMTNGWMGIAVGGGCLSDEQAEMIIRSPLEEIILATDNDRAGERLKDEIIQKLSKYISIKIVKFPSKYKDLNSLANAHQYIEAAQVIKPLKITWLSACY